MKKERHFFLQREYFSWLLFFLFLLSFLLVQLEERETEKAIQWTPWTGKEPFQVPYGSREPRAVVIRCYHQQLFSTPAGGNARSERVRAQRGTAQRSTAQHSTVL